MYFMKVKKIRKFAILGVCANMMEGDFDYYITTVTIDDKTNDMKEINVATQTYAVFTCPLVEVQEMIKKSLQNGYQILNIVIYLMH